MSFTSTVSILLLPAHVQRSKYLYLSKRWQHHMTDISGGAILPEGAIIPRSPLICTCTRTQAHVHTHVYMRTPACTHLIGTHVHKRTHEHTRGRICTHRQTHTLAHTHTFTRAQPRRHTHTHVDAQTHDLPYAVAST